MTNVMEEVREYSVGRSDGAIIVTPLTFQEAKDLVLSYADDEQPIASKVTDHAKAYLVRQAREGWATVNGQHVESIARALGDSIYLIQAAQSLAFHQESFDRVVEAYRQG